MTPLEQELYNLHKASLQAHLDKDIAFFTKNVDLQTINVSNGEIYYSTPEQITSMFSNYLPNTEFSAYQDVQEPIIRISDDGSMGWVLAKVHVAGVRQMDAGPVAFDNIWAWLMLYHRKDGRWIRDANISTVKAST